MELTFSNNTLYCLESLYSGICFPFQHFFPAETPPFVQAACYNQHLLQPTILLPAQPLCIFFASLLFRSNQGAEFTVPGCVFVRLSVAGIVMRRLFLQRPL